MSASDICQSCGGTGFRIDPIPLKMLRIKKGIPQGVCAERMDISQGYLSDLEHGWKDWNTELLGRFNKVINKQKAK